MKKKVEKKGLKLPNKSVGLTIAQKEVLHLLTDEFLTIKQIAHRRECSLQAVYKIVSQIKKKGDLSMGLNRVEKVEPTFNQSDIRLHGQEINIRIFWQDNKYQKLLQKSNTLFLDGNTIRLYKNSIEVYLGQSFFGKTINQAEKNSLEYLQRFLKRLEHELKVGIIKNKARNIKIVNQHYARGDSEICDNSIKNRERVWVHAEEDGKLAFITDDSFGFREDEALHPTTAKQDRKAVDKQVNDWRLKNPPTSSELAKFGVSTQQGLKILTNVVSKQAKMVSGLPRTLNKLEKQINSHLALVKEYRKENTIWRKHTEKRIRRELQNREQTKLGGWF